MHFFEASSGYTNSRACIFRNPSMTWEEETEKAFHIASVMELPSYSPDSLLYM